MSIGYNLIQDLGRSTTYSPGYVSVKRILEGETRDKRSDEESMRVETSVTRNHIITVRIFPHGM